MQTRLNAGFFFTHGTTRRFHWLSRCCTLKLLGDAHAQGAVKQVSAGVAPCNMVSFVKLSWTSVARQASRKVELLSISATAKSFTVHHYIVVLLGLVTLRQSETGTTNFEIIIFYICLGAGSRQYCRYSNSHLGITPLKKFDLGGVWTHDLRIRSSDALPTELRGHYGSRSG